MSDEKFTGDIIDETTMAIRFKPLEAYLDPVWLPKSQIAVNKRQGTRAEVEMPIWLAKDKGIY